MNKHIATSSCFPLLPLAAALLLALAPGSEANARGGSDGSRLERIDDGVDVQQMFAAMRLHRQSQSQPDQLGRRCRTTIVRNCRDSGAGSLRDAVAGATSGDTIDLGQLRCAEITLTSGAINVAVDDLVIEGSRHHAIRIDGNRADRVFDHTGVGTLSLSELTVRRGAATAPAGFVYGGCIRSAGSVTLDHAAVVECDVSSPTESAYGGGLFAAGTATVTSSTVAANTVHGALHAVGGGVLAYAVVVRDSTISGNTATAIGNADIPVGEAIDASMGGIGSIYDLDISDSVIHGNSTSASSAFPGQVVVSNEAGAHTFSTLTLTRSTVSDNTAYAVNTSTSPTVYAYAYSIAGGVRGASLVITDSTVSGNSASAVVTNSEGVGLAGARGGGVHTLGFGGGVTLTNSTISGNASTYRATAHYAYGYATGGGIQDNGQSLVLRNSTIASNTAELGAGIHQYNGASTHSDSSIIARNTAGATGADWDGAGSITVVGANNLVGSVGAALALPGGTLFADPMLAPLADNGGPTRTHALRSGSPAINTGNNAAGLPFDQRGHGFARKAGPATDIGAFERQSGH
jgi:hypothetical protein